MASIVRYEPFSWTDRTDRWTRPTTDRLFGSFDRIVQEALNFTPAGAGLGRSGVGRSGVIANLFETNDGYVVELPLPGVKAEHLELSVQKNLLTLKATREWAAPEQARTLWQGFGAGRWQQTFTLPGEVDAERVEARLEDGILRLQLPKAEHSRPRQIKVQTYGDVKPVVAVAPADAAEVDTEVDTASAPA
ncbi:MAG: Hsp20/alpha crystallin family protein [Chloroflexota bacterium]|nr:Hsp20/alpha crystallin family protein [Chloroflexota bacterium]